MTEARPVYVIDASVALKWVLRLPDEPHLDFADRLQDDYAHDRVSLVAPGPLAYEVGHALLRAVRRGRITADEGRQALDTLAEWRIRRLDAIYQRRDEWVLALAYGCSYYDAHYLAVSLTFGYPLVHADQHLRQVLGGRFALEIWIEDYG